MSTPKSNKCGTTITLNGATFSCSILTDTWNEKKVPHKSHRSTLMKGDHLVHVLWHIPEVHV